MRDHLYFSQVAKLSGSKGRAGIINTTHGEIKTPAYIPVATQATIKTVAVDFIKDIGAEAILANAYHLFLQPGDDIIARGGGLAKFMNWNGPTFTDSGGFQILSLSGGRHKKVLAMNEKDSKLANRDHPSTSGLVKIDDNGVDFISHRSGKKYRFTPEKSIQIQHNIGADIIFTFDELTTLAYTKDYQVVALERTRKWAERCLAQHNILINNNSTSSPGLWAVVQGAQYEDLRRKAVKDILEISNISLNKGKCGFSGIGIGGAILKHKLGDIIGWIVSELPDDMPRHLLGISEPDDIFAAVEAGVDTFDCVAPSRVARNGAVYSFDGRFNITNAKYRRDFTPISDEIINYTSAYTKAYIHHLFKARESLAATLCTIHNISFMVNLVAKIRESIINGTYYNFKTKFLSRYYS